MATGTPDGAPRVELRSLARGSTLNLVGFVGSGLLGFALAVVVARGLGAAGAGVFFAVVGVFTIMKNVAELGADTGFVRFIPRFRELGRIADIRPTIAIGLLPVFLVGILGAIALYLLAPFFAREVVGDRPVAAQEFIRVLAPFLPVATGSTVCLAATRGFGTMVPFVAVESLGKPAIRPIAVLAVILGGIGSVGIALSWAVPEAVGFVVALTAALWLLRRAEDEASGSLEPRRDLRTLAGEFWRFAAPRGMAAAFQVTVIWLDVLLVGIFRPTREVGIYAAASRIVTVGTFALQAVRLAIAPQVSALLARRDRDGAQMVFQTATWWLMALSWPLFLTLAVFAPFLLRVFGRDFVEGQHALLILSIAMLANLGSGNVSVVLLMGGKSVWNMVNTAVALTLNVGLNLLLIPRFGIEGAAFAWAVSIIADNGLAVFEVWRFMGLGPFGGGYAVVVSTTVAIFVGLGLLVRWTLGMSIPAFALFAVVGVGIYAVVLWRAREPLRLTLLRDSLRRGADAPGR